jgi:hypothetical protein
MSPLARLLFHNEYPNWQVLHSQAMHVTRP